MTVDSEIRHRFCWASRNKPSVEQMDDHVMALIKQHELSCFRISQPRFAKAAIKRREIWIAPIKSRISYMIALHEIGHCVGRRRTSRYRIVRERDAWRWAKANALIWTARMERRSLEALTYSRFLIKIGRLSALRIGV